MKRIASDNISPPPKRKLLPIAALDNISPPKSTEFDATAAKIGFETISPPESTESAKTSPLNISPPKRRVPPTATAANVANFFKPASDKIKVPEKVIFKIHESVLVARHSSVAKSSAQHSSVAKSSAQHSSVAKSSAQHSSVAKSSAQHSSVAKSSAQQSDIKIAAFDFDDTLVTTASGNRFSKNAQDWKWWHDCVPDRLNQLHQNGYLVVVLSNQGAVKLHADLKGDMKSLSNFKGKVANVLARLDLPITVYAATAKDIYRKPRTGMWELLLKDLDIESSQVDHMHSVFVGDAGGREGDKLKGIRKDHSSSDRDLATNIGITFHTPEEFFLAKKPQPFTRVFEPARYLDANHTVPVFTKQNDLDIVLFCGSPGAGKSTFYWTHLQPLAYERVNQDILKTRDKCMQTATQAIQSGRSVAVDNTNADTEVRGAWVALARRLQVSIRLVHFTAPVKLCEHNDTVRALSGKTMNPEGRKMLPKLAFSGYAARYREPTLSEGFADITRVDFMFTGTEEQKHIWRRYWIS